MQDNEKLDNSSVREVEVIISVVIVLTLSEGRSDKVEGEWHPGDSHPDSDQYREILKQGSPKLRIFDGSTIFTE